MHDQKNIYSYVGIKIIKQIVKHPDILIKFHCIWKIKFQENYPKN